MNSNTDEYKDLGYTGTGYLIIRVTTASSAIPLDGAVVLVRGTEENYSSVIARLTTANDGNTQKIALAAPPRSLSETPGNSKPFATYGVEVFLDGYSNVSVARVPVFDGITSVQPINMIPLSSNKYPDSFNPYDHRNIEGSGEVF